MILARLAKLCIPFRSFGITPSSRVRVNAVLRTSWKSRMRTERIPRERDLRSCARAYTYFPFKKRARARVYDRRSDSEQAPAG